VSPLRKKIALTKSNNDSVCHVSPAMRPLAKE
jgi:hypothetical protein